MVATLPHHHRDPFDRLLIAQAMAEGMGYFGTTARQAMRLPPLARGGELVLTRAVAADPRVAILLQARGLEGEVLPTDLPDHPHVHRLAASVRLGAGGTVAGR